MKWVHDKLQFLAIKIYKREVAKTPRKVKLQFILCDFLSGLASLR